MPIYNFDISNAVLPNFSIKESSIVLHSASAKFAPEINGVKIGFIGLSTEEILTKVNKSPLLC